MRTVKVFVSGSFDMLHSGHIKFLKEASLFGQLYVGIGSDGSIEKYKRKKPICPAAERLFMLRSIKYVHEVFVNSGEGPLDFKEDIIRLKPDMLIVNEDQISLSKEDLCWELGIGYIVLKRRTEPGLPVRSTTKYRELI